MNLKQQAGERAVEFVKDGMTIGMGTGSTVYWTIRRLGELVQEGLKIRIVPTSKQTENLAIEQHISLVTFADVRELDLTIDGADEINPELDLIKGGGGALLREKLVATASKQLIVVADQSKVVSRLGTVPLPVEVVPFGWETTIRRIENLKLSATLRIREGKVFITDNGNYILDCHCGKIENPVNLHHQLKLLTGVVETGLFTRMASIAVIASADGVRIIEKGAKNL